MIIFATLRMYWHVGGLKHRFWNVARKRSVNETQRACAPSTTTRPYTVVGFYIRCTVGREYAWEYSLEGRCCDAGGDEQEPGGCVDVRRGIRSRRNVGRMEAADWLRCAR